MATRSRVDAVLRKRLRDGSLAVGVEPPVDACVRELAAFRKTLLSSGTGDTSPADRQQACQAACDDFCQALDVLDFHVRRTRHAGHIVSAETASLHALQSKIAELQELARTEIAALKLDLKAAYQTHLNKEEYEVRARPGLQLRPKPFWRFPSYHVVSCLVPCLPPLLRVVSVL